MKESKTTVFLKLVREGKSIKEASEIAGIAEATAKTQLSRARRVVAVPVLTEDEHCERLAQFCRIASV